MVETWPSERGNWTLPSYPVTIASTLPNYEESLPLRVNREGVQNYLKNRGTLNFGDWSTEGRRRSVSSARQPLPSDRSAFVAPPPKVLGADALRNYTRSRSSAPNLIGGVIEPPHPHHQFRVKPEAQKNYKKNQQTQMKVLMENYGKLTIPDPPAPHIQGQMATNNFYRDKQGHLNKVFYEYGHVTPVAPPDPHVKGMAAEMNFRKGRGVSNLLEHNNTFREPQHGPHVKGNQAHVNYEVAQGRAVSKLFHEYGKLPHSARTMPKVKYGGLDNFQKARGEAMRKTLSQCPPSRRYIERPQSAPLWT